MIALEIPDYRQLSPEVAARFARIRQRPVILSVRDLQKTFGRNGSSHTAFEGVSLEIHRREFICVIGPSGCGKSTLIRIVAGLDEATGGEVLLDGKAVIGSRSGSRHGLSRLHAISLAHGEAERDVRPRDAREGGEHRGSGSTAMAGNGRSVEVRKRLSHELSGGMKQRVAIARALPTSRAS